MATRKKAQKTYRHVKEGVKTRVEKARTSTGQTGKVVEGSIKGGKKIAKVVGDASTKVVAKTTRLVGLEEYRIELEKALDEAVRVIAVQEARIARLEAEIQKRDGSK